MTEARGVLILEALLAIAHAKTANNIAFESLPSRAAIYWEDLKDYTKEELTRAMALCTKKRSRFPTPADIRREAGENAGRQGTPLPNGQTYREVLDAESKPITANWFMARSLACRTHDSAMVDKTLQKSIFNELDISYKACNICKPEAISSFAAQGDVDQLKADFARDIGDPNTVDKAALQKYVDMQIVYENGRWLATKAAKPQVETDAKKEAA
jgi:hypothetical protein